MTETTNLNNNFGVSLTFDTLKQPSFILNTIYPVTKTDYKVIINIMTYDGDQNVLPFCVRGLLKVFEKNEKEIYIMDDSNHPMAEEVVKSVKALSPSVHYETTTFERNHNLNGKVCCVEMVKKFKEHSEEGALNLKVDPDTIVMHRRCFDEFMSMDNSGYMSCQRPGCYFSGVCYGFKTDVIDKALQLIKQFPIPYEKGPEDYCIGVAMCAGALPRLSVLLSPWNEKSKEGSYCGWNYSCDLNEKIFKMYYELFQYVSVGNWFLTPGLTKEDRVAPAAGLLKMVESIPDEPGKTSSLQKIWL